jgi:hypothetical protein
VDTERFSVTRFGKETFVRAFPISVDGHIGTGSFKAEPVRWSAVDLMLLKWFGRIVGAYLSNFVKGYLWVYYSCYRFGLKAALCILV